MSSFAHYYYLLIFIHKQSWWLPLLLARTLFSTWPLSHTLSFPSPLARTLPFIWSFPSVPLMISLTLEPPLVISPYSPYWDHSISCTSDIPHYSPCYYPDPFSTSSWNPLTTHYSLTSSNSSCLSCSVSPMTSWSSTLSSSDCHYSIVVDSPPNLSSSQSQSSTPISTDGSWPTNKTQYHLIRLEWFGVCCTGFCSRIWW